MPYYTTSGVNEPISDLEMKPEDVDGLHGVRNFLRFNFTCGHPGDAQFRSLCDYLKENMKGPFFINTANNQIGILALLPEDRDSIREYNVGRPWEEHPLSLNINVDRLNLRAIKGYAHQDVCMNVLTGYVCAVGRQIDQNEMAYAIRRVWPHRNGIVRLQSKPTEFAI